MVPELPIKVMVVEDQALLAMELEYMLREQGYEVVGCAMDSKEAETLAARTDPDVALVDLNLRDGLSGPGLAERLYREAGITVIFLTANPEQVPPGFAGAIGVLLKPFEAKTLQESVDFAARFRRHGRVEDCPRRLRLAPTLDVADKRLG